MTDETAIPEAPRRGRPPKVAEDDGMVWVTVTKAGDGKVSTGEHVTGVGDQTYARGARFRVPPETAAALEARHFVETD